MERMLSRGASAAALAALAPPLLWSRWMDSRAEEARWLAGWGGSMSSPVA